MIMNGRTINIGLHVVIWIFFLMLPFLILPNALVRFSTESCHRFFFVIISVMLVLHYYFNYYYAIPRFYFKQRYFAFIALHTTFILAVFLLVILTGLVIGPCPSPGLDPPLKNLTKSLLPRHILVLIFSLFMALNERLRTIDSQKTKTELQFLRTQINPHFLFNVLNTIYGQAIIKSDHTADSIAKLSDLMRYSLKEANVPKVTLEKEITYLENYISLQALRLTDKTKVDFQVKGNITSLEIPPMLLIPFIENAFKYGVSNEVATSIKIIIEVIDGQLYFLVNNTKLPNRVIQEESNQIGMENVKNRLDLIYGSRYTLEIKDTDTNYCIQLKIFVRN